MTRFTHYIFFILLVFVSGCAGKYVSPGPVELSIVHVNDVHAHLEPIPIKLKLADQKTYTVAGGLLPVLSLLAEEKKQDKAPLFLNAGDQFQGTLYYNKFKGQADVALLNTQPPAAFALGNHEFDDGTATLAEFMKKANFPILCANIDASKDAHIKGLFLPYTIKEVRGENVAIIGLITPTTKVSSKPGPDIEFLNPKDMLPGLIQELEAKGINKIIVLSHLGYEEDVALAQQVEGMDIIIGGHSHALLGDFSSVGLKSRGPYPTVATSPEGHKVYVLQAWKWGYIAGKVNVSFDSKGLVTDFSGEPVLILGDTFLRKNKDGKKVPVTTEARQEIAMQIDSMPTLRRVEPDSEAVRVLEPYTKKLESMRTKVVAQVRQNLPAERPTRDDPKIGEKNLMAPLVAHIMLNTVNSTGLNADCALLNAGGVRKALMKGDFTVGDAYEVLPFGNTIYVVEVPGATIKQALDFGTSCLSNKEHCGRFPYGAGIRYVFNPKEKVGAQVTNIQVRTTSGSWAKLDPQKTYRVVMNAFMAGGGDGYNMFKNVQGYKLDTGFVVSSEFLEYASKQKILQKTEHTGVTIK